MKRVWLKQLEVEVLDGFFRLKARREFSRMASFPKPFSQTHMKPPLSHGVQKDKP
jgi:hypothetical protein